MGLRFGYGGPVLGCAASAGGAESRADHGGWLGQDCDDWGWEVRGAARRSVGGVEGVGGAVLGGKPVAAGGGVRRDPDDRRGEGSASE
jgi:hypothetical protein